MPVVPINREEFQDAYNLLEERHGRWPTVEELAEELELSTSAVIYRVKKIGMSISTAEMVRAAARARDVADVPNIPAPGPLHPPILTLQVPLDAWSALYKLLPALRESGADSITLTRSGQLEVKLGAAVLRGQL